MESLDSAVTRCLKDYFHNLAGETPASNLYQHIVETIEKPLIVETLILVENNQRKAAEILGINRNTLRKKMQSLGIV